MQNAFQSSFNFVGFELNVGVGETETETVNVFCR